MLTLGHALLVSPLAMPTQLAPGDAWEIISEGLFWQLFLALATYLASLATMAHTYENKQGWAGVLAALFLVSRQALPLLFCSLLLILLVVIGSLFFIVPGIVIAMKLLFVPFLVLLHRVEVSEAFAKSWTMTDGNTIALFFIHVAFGLLTSASNYFFGLFLPYAVVSVFALLAYLFYTVFMTLLYKSLLGEYA